MTIGVVGRLTLAVVGRLTLAGGVIPVVRPGRVVLVLAAVVLGFAWFAGQARAEPVPCTVLGGDRYECEWWRPGDGHRGGAMVVRDGQLVGYLHQGGNWINCQKWGARVTSGANWNHWYGWTTADNGELGWASALDARGGSNDGQFDGVPDCREAHGAAPAVEGVWETTPPVDQPAPPPPPPSPAPTGPAPVDHGIYRAGQSLKLIGPDEGMYCTAAFPLLIRGRVWGLTAGHCAPPASWTVWRVDPRAELGRVQKNVHMEQSVWRLFRFRDDVDALIFGGSFGLPGPWRQEIDRGNRVPPLRVVGPIVTEAQRRGRPVCFVGRTSGSGPQQCGKITERVSARGEHLICTTISSDYGDSGGPVYSNAVDGRTGAVGIVKGETGRFPGDMCYTPLEDILKAFGAQLAGTGVVPTAQRWGASLLRSVRVGRRLTTKSGLHLRVRLAKHARVTVRLARRGARGRAGQWQAVRLRGRGGWNSYRIQGVRGRRLQRGRYELRIAAHAGRLRALPWKLSFHIR